MNKPDAKRLPRHRTRAQRAQHQLYVRQALWECPTWVINLTSFNDNKSTSHQQLKRIADCMGGSVQTRRTCLLDDATTHELDSRITSKEQPRVKLTIVSMQPPTRTSTQSQRNSQQFIKTVAPTTVPRKAWDPPRQSNHAPELIVLDVGECLLPPSAKLLCEDLAVHKKVYKSIATELPARARDVATTE